ncbi:helix-turn-helix domain-containing protein [Methylobacterium sp. JK268]
MSISALNWALNVQVGSASQKLVLLLLANFADEQGRSWPSQKVIAEKACLSVRSVVTALAELETAGFIRREARWRPGGSRGTDIIHLAIDGPNAQIFHPSSKGENSARMGKHAKSDDQTRKNGASKGANASPLATLEPSSEPSETPSEATASGKPDVPDLPAPLSLKDRLWAEAKPGLMGLGVTEREAGSIIGGALKFCGDPGRVLWACGEAIRARTGDPRPYVMRLLSSDPAARAPPSAKPLSAATRRTLLLRQIARGDHAPDEDHDAGDHDGPVIDHEGDGRPDRPLQRAAGGDPRRFPAQGHLRLASSRDG